MIIQFTEDPNVKLKALTAQLKNVQAERRDHELAHDEHNRRCREILWGKDYVR